MLLFFFSSGANKKGYSSHNHSPKQNTTIFIYKGFDAKK